jgi:hypothetical protein
MYTAFTAFNILPSVWLAMKHAEKAAVIAFIKKHAKDRKKEEKRLKVKRRH